jgi:hypothetical protein
MQGKLSPPERIVPDRAQTHSFIKKLAMMRKVMKSKSYMLPSYWARKVPPNKTTARSRQSTTNPMPASQMKHVSSVCSFLKYFRNVA